MAEYSLNLEPKEEEVEFEEDEMLTSNILTDIICKKRLREEQTATSEERKYRGAWLAANRPDYCLKKGVGCSSSALCGSGQSLRHQHRDMLSRLLRDLMRQHNWADASGVLAVLLRATVADKSPSTNHAKYTAVLEILNQIKGESLSWKKIQSVYDLWMKKTKTGPLKNWSTKERFAVQLEYIISCLQRGSMEDVHQAALCVMQDPGFYDDPVANLMVGIAFCQLWYNDVPKELQLTKLDLSATYMEPEIPVALEADVAKSVKKCDSTSVAVDKVTKDDGSPHKESTDNDDNVRKETPHTSYQPPDLPYASIFYSQGLPPWILPLKLPSADENLEDAMCRHRKLLNSDYYKRALKYLRVALNSTPPVAEAFHPLIQVQEAIDELENARHGFNTVLKLRVKACLMEHFDTGNHVKLRTCYEDILNKDPTCSDSLGKLILMHRRGDYGTQSLVEMVALHLDGFYGISDTWQELASCFLKLCAYEEDIFSTCGDSNDPHPQGHLKISNKIPELFTGESWSLRCRWWLNRYFTERILTSDIASGDLKLLTYKAAAASYMYGRRFKYVVKVAECLEKEKDVELYSVLQMHILNSVGFYSIPKSNW